MEYGYHFQVEEMGLPAEPAWAHIHNRANDWSPSICLSLCVLCGWPKDQTAELISSWEPSLAINEPLGVSQLSSGPFWCIKLTRFFNPAHVKLLLGSPSRFYLPSFSFSPFCRWVFLAFNASGMGNWQSKLKSGTMCLLISHGLLLEVLQLQELGG